MLGTMTAMGFAPTWVRVAGGLTFATLSVGYDAYLWRDHRRCGVLLGEAAMAMFGNEHDDRQRRAGQGGGAAVGSKRVRSEE